MKAYEDFVHDRMHRTCFRLLTVMGLAIPLDHMARLASLYNNRIFLAARFFLAISAAVIHDLQERL